MNVPESAPPDRPPSRSGGAMLLTDHYQPRPGVVVVTVRGELDLDTEPAFRAALASAAAAADPDIGMLVCYLSDVVFMSCGALSVLVQARADLHARASVLRVVAQRSIVTRVITLCGLADALNLHHDLAVACQLRR